MLLYQGFPQRKWRWPRFVARVKRCALLSSSIKDNFEQSSSTSCCLGFSLLDMILGAESQRVLSSADALPFVHCIDFPRVLDRVLLVY